MGQLPNLRVHIYETTSESVKPVVDPQPPLIQTAGSPQINKAQFAHHGVNTVDHGALYFLFYAKKGIGSVYSYHTSAGTR